MEFPHISHRPMSICSRHVLLLHHHRHATPFNLVICLVVMYVRMRKPLRQSSLEVIVFMLRESTTKDQHDHHENQYMGAGGQIDQPPLRPTGAHYSLA
jgi:hypothetical protein